MQVNFSFIAFSSSSIFVCEQHSNVRFVIDDVHLRIDRILAGYIQRPLVRWLLLLVLNVLTLVRPAQPKDLQIILLLDLHAVPHEPQQIDQLARQLCLNPARDVTFFRFHLESSIA